MSRTILNIEYQNVNPNACIQAIVWLTTHSTWNLKVVYIGPLLRGGVDCTLDCRAGGHGIESCTVLG